MKEKDTAYLWNCQLVIRKLNISEGCKHSQRKERMACLYLQVHFKHFKIVEGKNIFPSPSPMEKYIHVIKSYKCTYHINSTSRSLFYCFSLHSLNHQGTTDWDKTIPGMLRFPNSWQSEFLLTMAELDFSKRNIPTNFALCCVVCSYLRNKWKSFPMGGYGLGSLSADFVLPDATLVTRATEILQGVKDSLRQFWLQLWDRSILVPQYETYTWLFRGFIKSCHEG